MTPLEIRAEAENFLDGFTEYSGPTTTQLAEFITAMIEVERRRCSKYAEAIVEKIKRGEP